MDGQENAGCLKSVKGMCRLNIFSSLAKKEMPSAADRHLVDELGEIVNGLFAVAVVIDICDRCRRGRSRCFCRGIGCLFLDQTPS